MPDVKEQTEIIEEAPPPKKGLLPPNLAPLLTKVAIFGVIGVVAIFAAFFLTTKVLKPMMAHKPAAAKVETSEQPKSEAAPAEEKPAEKGEKSEGGKEGKAGGKYYTIESIVVNPAGTGGTRFLSCSVSFEMGSDQDFKAFEAKDVQIKDILITILSSKTVDELADIRLRNKMRQQMLAVVNHFTAPVQAKAVFLTDFVLQ